MATVSSGSVLGKERSDQLRIVQREREAIVAFACSNARPGCLVVSTSREVQELNLERVLDKENVRELHSASGFLNNRVELDIALSETSTDKIKDNDDYQLLSSANKNVGLHAGAFVSCRSCLLAPILISKKSTAPLRINFCNFH